METRLHIDNRDRKLYLSGKTSFLHSSDVELRLKHIVDTESADVRVFGSLMKHLSFGDISRGKPGVDSRLRLSAGLSANSSSVDTLLVLKGKKHFRVAEKIRLIRGKDTVDNSTDVLVKASYSYNLKRDVWTGDVFCGISHTMFRLHDTMDIRLSAGLETCINKNKLQSFRPLIKVEENNWTWSTDLSGKWHVDYLL
jgi:hypothetical protein